MHVIDTTYATILDLNNSISSSYTSSYILYMVHFLPMLLHLFPSGALQEGRRQQAELDVVRPVSQARRLPRASAPAPAPSVAPGPDATAA